MIVQSPEPSAVVVPTEPATPSNSSTVLFASAVPQIDGVLSQVLSSVSELPLSLAAARSGAAGAAGAVVSIVSVSADEAALVLPAASVDVALRS